MKTTPRRLSAKISIHLHGFGGWAKRATARAQAITEGREFPPSRALNFEDADDLVRFLHPARPEIAETLKDRSFTIKELAAALGRDIEAVRLDIAALENGGLAESEETSLSSHVPNSDHEASRPDDPNCHSGMPIQAAKVL